MNSNELLSVLEPKGYGKIEEKTSHHPFVTHFVLAFAPPFCRSQGEYRFLNKRKRTASKVEKKTVLGLPPEESFRGETSIKRRVLGDVSGRNRHRLSYRHQRVAASRVVSPLLGRNGRQVVVAFA